MRPPSLTAQSLMAASAGELAAKAAASNRSDSAMCRRKFVIIDKGLPNKSAYRQNACENS
jgi:hypothetical protein